MGKLWPASNEDGDQSMPRLPKKIQASSHSKNGALPDFRVNKADPFEKAAVDLGGPFEVKMNGRANHKVWLSIFMCCVTRAVHVELVYKQSSEFCVRVRPRFRK